MNHLLDRIVGKGQFKKNVAILMGGTALGQVITIVASPVLTRLYTPTEFGLLASYVSVVGVLTVVASLRYNLAIPLPKDDQDAAQLFGLSSLLTLVFGFVVAIGVWTTGSWIEETVKVPGLSSALWLVPFSVMGAGFNEVAKAWAIRRGQFSAMAKTSVVQGLGQVLTQLALGLTTPSGAIGLAVGDAIGRTTGSSTLLSKTWIYDQSYFRQISWKAMKKIGHRYRKFPLVSSWSALINNAGLSVPPLVLAALYGPQAAGIFALSQRIVGSPMQLLGRPISQVYLGEISAQARSQGPALRAFFSRSARTLVLVGAIPISLAGLVGPRVFTLLFGSEWSEVGTYIRVLGLMYLVQFVAGPLSQTLNVMERQDLQLAWDVGRLVLSVSSIFFASYLRVTAITAIAMYAGAMFVAYCALFVMSYLVLRTKDHLEQSMDQGSEIK